ncbi:MAG: hypothetical protein WEB04_07565 [Dehalococcoidia bacterium]
MERFEYMQVKVFFFEVARHRKRRQELRVDESVKEDCWLGSDAKSGCYRPIGDLLKDLGGVGWELVVAHSSYHPASDLTYYPNLIYVLKRVLGEADNPTQ